MSSLPQLQLNSDSEFIAVGAKPRKRETKTYEIVNTCLLLDHRITFNGKRERKRNGKLPKKLFRMAYEYSATLSAYVGNDNHRKHREQMHLKFDDNNAYQPFGTFFPTKDLNRFRVQRHLTWNKVVDASSYVSAVDSLDKAKKLAKDRYHNKSPPSDRVHISVISTEHLVPATVRGREQTTQNTYKNAEDLAPIRPPTITNRDVCVLVWIRASALPSDGSNSITLEQWAESGADMWISVKEQCEDGSDMRLRAATSHDSEWLSCGSILKKHVVGVMPYDGNTVHNDDETRPVVRSKRNLGWIWSWDLSRWTQDASLLQTPKSTGQKRKRSDPQQEDDNEQNEPGPSQRARLDEL